MPIKMLKTLYSHPLTLGYILLTGRVVSYTFESETFTGQFTPRLQAKGSGKGNGIGIPKTYPCTTAFIYLVSTSVK